MPITYKVLGQSSPAATTTTTLYTVTTGTSAVASTLAVCNFGTTTGTYRIAVQPAGAAIENKHYIVYDSSLSAKDTITFTIGLTLSATDVVSVYASTANFSFNLFGSEIT